MAQEMPPQAIAIIGSACRLPGHASSPSKLWELLKNPKDLLKEVPRDRFHWESVYRPDGKHGASITKHAYWLEENIRHFDPEFFKLNPAEAETLDPQHRLLLENVYEAMEAAGLTMEGLQGTKTGVFVGMMSRGYFNNANKDLEACGGPILSTGTSRAMASNRISYTFDFRGPSMTLDTACSSSMMAVHLAVGSLRKNESTVAFACGTNLNIEPNDWVSLTKMNMISADGRSKMFDETADGYGRGEGIGVVCLKRLDQALKDGDHIECVIRETGTNQDGHTKGITMPSAAAQAALIRDTYRSAGLDLAQDVARPSFFEAHGTGTAVGDPLEAEAVQAAFFPPGKEYPEDETLYIGSIKSICGHLEGGAGIAGLLRAALAVQHGRIPPNLLYMRMNPNVAKHAKHLRVQTAEIPWPSLPSNCPRRASINSFGFGGSNVHAIVESYRNTAYRRVPSTLSIGDTELVFTPFTFSAISERALVAVMKNYLKYLEEPGRSVSLRDLAWTMQYKRSQNTFRCAIPAINLDDLRKKLRKAIDVSSSETETSNIVRASQSGEPRIMGVFTGQGAQWPGMGKDLIERSPFAFEIIARLDEALASLPEDHRPTWKIKDELAIDSNRSRLSEAALSQPLTTAIQILLVDLLDIAGVKLRTIVGHSSGEIAAAYAAGMISAEDAIRIAYYRGLDSVHAGGNGQAGAMFATSLTPEKAHELCHQPGFRGRITIAAYNAPSMVTISGDSDAIDEAIRQLESKDIFARKLQVEKAYHSHHMEPCAEKYLASIQQFSSPGVPNFTTHPLWFSSVFNGKRMDSHRSPSASYWVKNMVSPVRFSDAVTKAISETGVPDIFLEIGPSPALQKPVREIIEVSGKNGIVYTGLLKRGSSSISAVSEALGTIWERFGRTAVNFEKLEMTLSRCTNPVIVKDLPTYPWLHDREYWWENRFLRRRYQALYPPNELLGEELSMGAQHETKWRSFLQPKDVPWLLDHKLNGAAVLPGAAYVAMAVTAARRIQSWRKQDIVMIEVNDLNFKLPLTFPDDVTSIETVLTVVNIRSTSQKGEADFVFDFCSHQRQDELMTAARGSLTVQFGKDTDRKYPESLPKRSNLTPLNLDLFYEKLDEKGYNYTGPFRGITSLHRRKDFSTGKMEFAPSDMTFHPALLDGLFQATFAAENYPGDSAMVDFRVPSLVRSIKVFPSRCEELKEALNFQVSKTGTSEYSGFLAGADDSGIALQMEGFCTAPFKMSTPEDDLKMFAEVVWRPYVRDARSLMSACVLAAHEKPPAVALERVAYYHMRRLNETIPFKEEQQAAPHLRHLLKFARRVSLESYVVENSHILPEWNDDTEEDIAELVSRYSSLVNMRLVDAMGKAYPLIVREQVTAHSVLTEDGELTRLYAEGLGLREANQTLAKVVSTISHQSPDIRILEIGAGTGSATRVVLPSTSFSSYTFTDVSSAFLGTAKEQFKRYSEKMTFSTLDLDKDFGEQGLTAQSFDVVIASNVLHALVDIESAMARIRQLLRPGGYIVCLELPVTHSISDTVIMGGMSGWWHRAFSDRTTPALTEEEWVHVLKSSGFSGLDAITPADDHFKQSYRVFVSQAVDDRTLALREPFGHHLCRSQESIMVIGCRSPANSHLADAVGEMLSPSFDKVIHVSDLDDINDDTPIPYAVLCLVELDEPVFQNMTATKWLAIQKIFSEATDVVWVSSQCKAPKNLQDVYCQMMVGLGRTVQNEIRDLRLRFFDEENPDDMTAERISRAMLEWHMIGQWVADGNYQALLPLDRELVSGHNSLLAPSVVHDNAKNNRYNSQHRRITTQLQPHDGPIQVSFSPSNGQYNVHETPHGPTNCTDDTMLVKMLYSTLHSLKFQKVGFLYLGLGICPDGSYAVVLSESNSSVLRLPRQAVHPVTFTHNPTERDLWLAGACILAERVVEGCNTVGNLLVLVSDAGFLSIIREKATRANKNAAFITSNPDFGCQGVTYLHHNTMNVQIRQAIHEQTDLFVNLSNRPDDEVLFKRVSGVLKGSCTKIKPIDSLLRPSAIRYGRPEASVDQFKSVIEETGHILGADNSTPPLCEHASVSVVTPGQLNKPAFHDPLAILNWTATATVPVAIQAVTATLKVHGNKTYIIIGTSDSAQSVCEMLIDHGAKHVVMASRKPQNLSGWVKDMGAKGSRVDLKAVDVKDAGSVRNMVTSIRTSPDHPEAAARPIGGVIHMGLALKDSAFLQMTFEDLQVATSVKVEGSLNLHEALLEENLDFFILTSSISYVAGNPGQSNYNAGNAFMTSLSHYRRKLGLCASVVHLGRVTGVGYITRTTQAQGSKDPTVEEYRKMGIYPISERDLHQIYAEAILASPADSESGPEIMTGFRQVSPELLEQAGASWAKQPMFGHLVSKGSRDTTIAKPKVQLSVREKLNEELSHAPTSSETTKETTKASSTESPVQEIVRTGLVDRLSVLLQIDAKDIAHNTSLLDMGIDSLVASEIGSWARKELKVQIPHSMIFEGASVDDIVRFAVAHLDEGWIMRKPGSGKEKK